MSLKDQLIHYWKLSKLVKSKDAMIAFFDENEEAFYLDGGLGEELENCKYTYCEETGLDKEELEGFHTSSWKSFPKEFKIYAFDYCISSGMAYEEIKDSMPVNEIVDLISLERLSSKIEDEGLVMSEAEDEIMLILERKVKQLKRSATEDDLYDATKKLLGDLRDWMDDNHPDNIKAA